MVRDLLAPVVAVVGIVVVALPTRVAVPVIVVAVRAVVAVVRRTACGTGRETRQEPFQAQAPPADPEAAVDADPGHPRLRRERVAQLSDPRSGDEVRVLDDVLGRLGADQPGGDAKESWPRLAERRVDVHRIGAQRSHALADQLDLRLPRRRAVPPADA